MQNSDVGPLHALAARFADGIQPKVAAPCKTAFNWPSVAVSNRVHLDKAEVIRQKQNDYVVIVVEPTKEMGRL